MDITDDANTNSKKKLTLHTTEEGSLENDKEHYS
jgi:hypothetical protein